MTKMTLVYNINKELRKVNDRIDQKIVRGESYDREARRHRELRTQLRQVERDAAFSRSFSLMSFFF
ncbi:MAG: hypothetical protein V4664_03605 [Patescibacteria group bacterium]